MGLSPWSVAPSGLVSPWECQWQGSKKGERRLKRWKPETFRGYAQTRVSQSHELCAWRGGRGHRPGTWAETSQGLLLQSPFVRDFASRSVGAKRIALKDHGGPVAMGDHWGWEKTVLWLGMGAQELTGREQGLEQMEEKSPCPQNRLKA